MNSASVVIFPPIVVDKKKLVGPTKCSRWIQQGAQQVLQIVSKDTVIHWK